MGKPFNGLFDVGDEKGFSHSEAIEKAVGKRDLPKNPVAIDLPCELDYHCPVCKYEHVIGGDYDERLTWSEYNGFLFCYVCNKDYPSALCMPDITRAVGIYLQCVLEARRAEGEGAQ